MYQGVAREYDQRARGMDGELAQVRGRLESLEAEQSALQVAAQFVHGALYGRRTTDAALALFGAGYRAYESECSDDIVVQAPNGDAVASDPTPLYAWRELRSELARHPVPGVDIQERGQDGEPLLDEHVVLALLELTPRAVELIQAAQAQSGTAGR